METNVRTAGISVVANSALMVGKLAAGAATNSVALWAGAIHSGVDLGAAVLSYFSVNQSKKPADDHHQYGHGKYQYVCAVIEAALIVAAAAMIIYQSVVSFYTGGPALRFPELGMAVTAVSALLSFLVAGKLSGSFRLTGSPAFRADYRHALVNGITSVVICAGLAAIWLTGLRTVDPLMGAVVAIVLLKEGYSHLKESAGGIVDASLPVDEEAKIKEILSRHGGKYVQYHELRTRRSGPDCYVDLHLVVPRDQVIAHTHQLCDAIERDIREILPGVNVLIHPEPCRPVSGECEDCNLDKTGRGAPSGPEDCTARRFGR